MICYNLAFAFFLAIVDHGPADASSLRVPVGDGNGDCEGTSPVQSRSGVVLVLDGWAPGRQS